MDDSGSIQQGQIEVHGARGPIAQNPRGEVIFTTRTRGVRRLASALAQTTNTTVFAATKDYDQITILVCNVDGAASRTYTLYHYPSAGAVADSTAISCKAATIDINSPHTWTGLGMLTGDVIAVTCSVNDKVNVTVYGLPTEPV